MTPTELPEDASNVERLTKLIEKADELVREVRASDCEDSDVLVAVFDYEETRRWALGQRSAKEGRGADGE